MGRRILVSICLLMLVLNLTACDSSLNEESLPTSESTESKQDEIVEADDSEESSVETADDTEDESVHREASLVENVVDYEGDYFKKSVFAVGSDKLYLCGVDEKGDYFLAGMEAEDSVFTRFSIEMPQDVRAFRMSVDTDGKCHVLWSGVNDIVIDGQKLSQLSFEKGYITIVDINGVVETTIDISEIVSEKKINPYHLVVDHEGNYYIDNKEEILKISAEGNIAEIIPCNGYVECIGIGDTGIVYSICDNNGVPQIGRIEDNSIIYYDVEIPVFDANYSNISAGIDTDVLVYNKVGGVFSFEPTVNEFKERIPNSELPISDQDVAGYGFLADERLCLLEQKDEVTRFYYIPAGKSQDQVNEQEFSWFADYNGEKLQRIPGTEGDTYSPAVCPDIVFYEAKEDENLEEIMHKMIDAMILPLTEPSENRAFTITEYRLEEQEYYLYDEDIQDVWLLPCINGYYSYTGTDLVTMETVMRDDSALVKDGMVPFMRQGSEETFAFILMKEGNIYRLQRMQDMEILYSQNN